MKAPRTMADLNADPRVEKAFFENDGCFDTRQSVWVYLKSDYISPEMECGSIHEPTVPLACEMLATVITRAEWEAELAEHQPPTKGEQDMNAVTRIEIEQAVYNGVIKPNPRWNVIRTHEDGLQVRLANRGNLDNAFKVGILHADYHGVPLVHETGGLIPFKRSTDPKSFCGITRPV